MRRSRLVLAMVVATLIFAAGDAHAMLLGVELSLPDITSNGTGTYSYNATTNLFKADATPLSITFDGVTPIPIYGVRDYSVGFYVDESGNFSAGRDGDDLIIVGVIDVDGDGIAEYSGTLLTGEVTKFGWQNIAGTTFDAFDFTFDATGGVLASFYDPGIGGGDIILSEDSTFAGNFNSNFSGTKAKHDTAPLVPEPTSMLLLGMGLCGLGAVRRKRFKA